MNVELPSDVASSLREEVVGGRFTSETDAVAEIVRAYFRQKQAGLPHSGGDPKVHAPDLGSIGAMRDAAEELDEVVADAMKRRAEPWRVIDLE